MINNEVSRFFIMLGRECNLQCKYCLQHDVVEKQLKHNINPKIYDFINNTNISEKRKQRISFYGGEPLIFWSLIKELYNNLKHPQRNFGIISNGKALTQEMVNFINENDIHLTISWDGNNVETTRGYDALKEKENLLLQVNNLGISGVLSNANYPLDFINAADKFNKKYYNKNNKNLNVNTDLIYNNCGNCDDLIKIDFYKWRLQMLEIKKMAIDFQEGIKPFTHAMSIMRQYTNYRNVRSNYQQKRARCGNGDIVQNIDLDGNLYLCHNSDIKLGTVDDSLETICNKAAELDPIYDIFKTECCGCDLMKYCRSGCMLMPPGIRKTYYCQLIRATYEPFSMEAKFSSFSKIFKS